MQNDNIIIFFKSIKLLLNFMLLTTIPSIAISKENIIIKNSDGSKEIECLYDTFTVVSSGKIELLLSENEKNCINKIDNTTDPIIKDPIIKDPIIKDPIIKDPIIEEGWVPDPYDVGSFRFSQNLYEGTSANNLSPEGFKVHVLDSENNASLPACYNRACFSPSDFNPGAREDSVYAIRGTKKKGEKLSIDFRIDRLAPSTNASAYNVTISSTPGKMKKSNFQGAGCRYISKDIQDISITLYSDEEYEKRKDIFNNLINVCHVPDGTKYYINFRPISKLCNHVGEKTVDFNGNIGNKDNIIGPCTIFFRRLF